MTRHTTPLRVIFTACVVVALLLSPGSAAAANTTVTVNGGGKMLLSFPADKAAENGFVDLVHLGPYPVTFAVEANSIIKDGATPDWVGGAPTQLSPAKGQVNFIFQGDAAHYFGYCDAYVAEATPGACGGSQPWPDTLDLTGTVTTAVYNDRPQVWKVGWQTMEMPGFPQQTVAMDLPSGAVMLQGMSTEIDRKDGKVVHTMVSPFAIVIYPDHTLAVRWCLFSASFTGPVQNGTLQIH